MQVFLLLALVFAIIIAVFAGYNTNTADINFLFWQAKGIPISIVILASAFVGAFFAFLLGISRILRSSLASRSDRKKIGEQQKQVTELQDANTRLQENVNQLQRENEQLRARMTSPSMSGIGSGTGSVQSGPSVTSANPPSAPETPTQPATGNVAP